MVVNRFRSIRAALLLILAGLGACSGSAPPSATQGVPAAVRADAATPGPPATGTAPAPPSPTPDPAAASAAGIGFAQALAGYQGGSPQTLAWSPDSRTLAYAAAEPGLRFWHPGDAEASLVAGISPITALAWSARGRLASATFGGTLRLWDDRGEVLAVLPDHINAVFALAWSPDGATLASAGLDRRILRWGDDGALRQTTRTDSQIWALAWGPDNLASGDTAPAVAWWDADGALVATGAGFADDVRLLAWSPDGATLAAGSSDGTIKLWDGAGGLQTTLSEHGEGLSGLAWSHDGRRLASAALDDTVLIRDLDAARPGRPPRGSPAADGAALAWHPAGALLAAGSFSGLVRLYAPDGRLVRVLEGHAAECVAVSWSPDGRWLASASLDGTVRIWRVED